MLLGAHVSTAGGVSNAPKNGTEIACETIQIFSKNQRQWEAKPYPDEELAAWHDNLGSSGLQKLIIHDSYLINLGAPKAEVHKRSVVAFADEMKRAAQLGIPYLNFHPGAHVGSGEETCIEKIVDTLQNLLAKQPDNPTVLLVENTAGQGSNVGYSFEQVGSILDGVDDERMGMCLDTQHAFAAGYDHRDAAGYDDLIAAIDDHVGLDRLLAFHLNDSKAELGSRVDRHDNLGAGAIGWDLFKRLVNDERFEGVPGVLETPGGPEKWVDEVAALKALRAPNAPDI